MIRTGWWHTIGNVRNIAGTAWRRAARAVVGQGEKGWGVEPWRTRRPRERAEGVLRHAHHGHQRGADGHRHGAGRGREPGRRGPGHADVPGGGAPRPSVTPSPPTLTVANLSSTTLAVRLPSGFTFASGVTASSFALVVALAIAAIWARRADAARSMVRRELNWLSEAPA